MPGLNRREVGMLFRALTVSGRGCDTDTVTRTLTLIDTENVDDDDRDKMIIAMTMTVTVKTTMTVTRTMTVRVRMAMCFFSVLELLSGSRGNPIFAVTDCLSCWRNSRTLTQPTLMNDRLDEILSAVLRLLEYFT